MYNMLIIVAKNCTEPGRVACVLYSKDYICINNEPSRSAELVMVKA